MNRTTATYDIETCGSIRMGLLPCLMAGLGLAAVVYALISETKAFRSAISEWAARDLTARTELAAKAIAEPLLTGDFRRIREFGDECHADGVRLTILSQPGGMIYDTLVKAAGDHGGCPEVVEARKRRRRGVPQVRHQRRGMPLLRAQDGTRLRAPLDSALHRIRARR